MHSSGSDVPIYGMNLGSVGFLMNEYRAKTTWRSASTPPSPARVHPLLMRTQSAEGHEDRPRLQRSVAAARDAAGGEAAHQVDGKVRLDELICDGILVSTPAGSTAYNLSAHGPILPIDAALLALTPLSPFRPRRWRGALLPQRGENPLRHSGAGETARSAPSPTISKSAT